MKNSIRLRALEKKDLRFVHSLNNNRSIMSYWFEEPYESFDELEDLYGKHIHDNTERRFIAEHCGADNSEAVSIGLVELIEIDYVHRKAEFQIIIAPGYQGQGHARDADQVRAGLCLHHFEPEQGFTWSSAVENEKSHFIFIVISGFIEEARLVQEYFTNGEYRDVLRMYIMPR